MISKEPRTHRAGLSTLCRVLTVAERSQLASQRWLVLDKRTEAGALEIAHQLGEVRQSEPDLLSAKSAEEARSWSLSGEYGRAAFPWHTDGAVADSPPRWVIMLLEEASNHPVPTELCNPFNQLSGTHLDAVRRAVLKVTDKNGKARYKSMLHCSRAGSIFRWDPRTCQLPASQSDLAVAMRNLTADTCVQWKPQRLLVFDNWHLIHRRPPVAPGEVRTLSRIYAFN
jgi:alpha-ketoglutarate-dependent taurine dioxygenase